MSAPQGRHESREDYRKRLESGSGKRRRVAAEPDPVAPPVAAKPKGKPKGKGK